VCAVTVVVSFVSDAHEETLYINPRQRLNIAHTYSLWLLLASLISLNSPWSEGLMLQNPEVGSHY
jgi:hypothetical protein